MVSTELHVDETVAERMGYLGVVAATSFPYGDDEAIEVALIPPEKGPYLTCNWLLVVHTGCDPDRPDLGTSMIEELDGDEANAVQRYSDVLDEIRAELHRNEEIKNLRSYSPM